MIKSPIPEITGDLQIAFQGNIKISPKNLAEYPNKFSVSLVDEGYALNFEKYRDVKLYRGLEPGYLPDGWIYSKKDGLVILFEAKPPSSEMNISQLIAYAKHYFGFKEPKSFYDSYRNFSWTDNYEFFLNLSKKNLSKQEKILCHDYLRYMKLFGVTPEKEFDIQPKDWNLFSIDIAMSEQRIGFEYLHPPKTITVNLPN
jgi:hypothetical protein